MKKDHLDKLLSMYLFWGMTATIAFAVFIFLLAAVYRAEKLNVFVLFLALLSGFLWIGATSLSRHFLVQLKSSTGQRLSLIEFLSTQFVVILFPFAYRRVKRETEEFKGRRRKKV
jgi:hypothetical protein